MIKNRRKSTRSTTARRAAVRKPTASDKAVGRQRATRTAKINARRGIQNNAQGKPSAMEIEREVYRQTRMNNAPKGKKAQAPARRSRKDSAAQVKARRQQKNDTKKKAQKKKGAAASVPPTWVAGTRHPPSKKAVNAAVQAMTDSGFKVPSGMQMVISFAPAPDTAPSNKKKDGNQKGGSQKGGNQKGSQKGGNNQKGKQNKGKGGGRKK